MTEPTRRKKIATSTPPGFVAYSVCKSVTLHVNTSYDMSKYRGKSKNITVNAFNKLKQNEQIMYSIIEKNCDNEYDQILRLVLFYVNEYNSENTLGKPHKKLFMLPGELVHSEMMEAFDDYMTRKFHAEQSFHQDLSEILSILGTEGSREVRKKLYHLLVNGADSGETIKLFQKILSENGCLKTCNFSFDTLIILDKIGTMSTKLLNSKAYDDSPYEDLAKRLQKIGKVYDIDKSKYEKFILSYCAKQEN